MRTLSTRTRGGGNVVGGRSFVVPSPSPHPPLLRPRRETKVPTEGSRGSVLPRAVPSSLSSKLVCMSVHDTRASKGR